MAYPFEQTADPHIVHVADVIFAQGSQYHCRCAQQMVLAKRAVSLLIDPVPGDQVALVRAGEDWFVTAILTRQSNQAVLSLPDEAHIQAESLHISAQHCTAEYGLYQCFSEHHHTITEGQQLQKATLLSQQAQHIGLTADKVLVNS